MVTILLARAASDRDVPERAPRGPVALALSAEVAGLGDGVVVVVAKLGVHGLAPRTWQDLHWFLASCRKL